MSPFEYFLCSKIYFYPRKGYFLYKIVIFCINYSLRHTICIKFFQNGFAVRLYTFMRFIGHIGNFLRNIALRRKTQYV